MPNNTTGLFKLGQVQTVEIKPFLWVVNMIGQRGCGSRNFTVGTTKFTIQPVKYEALRECLIRTAQIAIEKDASIHCPKFGSGLAGGNWGVIESLIQQILVDAAGLSVTVYNWKP